MKNIEEKISSLVEQQFPNFYKEEGQQFIAFVKSYYEWLEEDNNTLDRARSLPEYRDIDETLDEFIVHFKEKYLKNIQFDTATNKQLLVKNALDLYRSKGTERSIDLFFKLVYGTDAEVYYPADNILRASDGVWEKPLYLEIGYSKYNIDYVDKQIVGAQSKATAFVEKYIRRKTNQGYVNLLYVSNIKGSFKNNEVLGIIKNDSEVFDIKKRSKLIGSIKNVTIQTKGKDFSVGDIVNLTSSDRGSGGLARVSKVGSGTGVVDFLLLDGGFGYSLDAESIVSEKVLDLRNVITPIDKKNHYNLLEKVYQPIVNVNSSSIDSSLQKGDKLHKYAGDVKVGSYTIIDLDSNNLTLSIDEGSISNTDTIFYSGNSVSVDISSVEDRTICGSIMSDIRSISIEVDSVDDISAGDILYQKDAGEVVAQGTVLSVIESIVNISLSIGSFKKSLVLVDSNDTVLASILGINFDVGVYDIQKSLNTINFTSANNNSILHSNSIYRYSQEGYLEAEAKIVTSSYSSNSGIITVLPLKGHFIEGDQFYTDSNSCIATTQLNQVDIDGGDFISSSFSKIISADNRTISTLNSTSFGSGANFEVSNLGDTETIFIGTDIISEYNNSAIDVHKDDITISSNTDFSSGDIVYQEVSKIAFNPNTSINSNTGFITLPDANTRYLPGDIVKYSVDSGNTSIKMMVPDDFYKISSSNSTGIILSYSYESTKDLNRQNYDEYNIGSLSEVGHYVSKIAYGTVE